MNATIFIRTQGRVHQVPAVLTNEHAVSSYGQDVLLLDGRAYGPGDLQRLAVDILRQGEASKYPEYRLQWSDHDVQAVHVKPWMDEADEAAWQRLLAAGWPLLYSSRAEADAALQQQAREWAQYRVAYDNAIVRGEVDW